MATELHIPSGVEPRFWKRDPRNTPTGRIEYYPDSRLIVVPSGVTAVVEVREDVRTEKPTAVIIMHDFDERVVVDYGSRLRRQRVGEIPNVLRVDDALTTVFNNCVQDLRVGGHTFRVKHF